MSPIQSGVSHISSVNRASPETISPKVEQKIQKSSKDFESVAIGEMLQPMFDTIDNSKGPFGGGNAEKQFRSLQVLELGKQISNAGGVGIAHQVYKKMIEMQSDRQKHGGKG